VIEAGFAPGPPNLHRIYCKTTRREACALKTMLHPLILLRISANLGRNSSKCESEPLLNGKPGSLLGRNQHIPVWKFYEGRA
jgi:hypothetical protein